MKLIDIFLFYQRIQFLKIFFMELVKFLTLKTIV